MAVMLIANPSSSQRSNSRKLFRSMTVGGGLDVDDGTISPRVERLMSRD